MLSSSAPIFTKLTDVPHDHAQLSCNEYLTFLTVNVGTWRKLINAPKESMAFLCRDSWNAELLNFCRNLQHGILLKSKKITKNVGKISLNPLSKASLSLHRLSRNSHNTNTSCIKFHLNRSTHVKVIGAILLHLKVNYGPYTRQIFTKFKLLRQVFVKASSTEFHENPTGGLAADTRFHTESRTVVVSTQGVQCIS